MAKFTYNGIEYGSKKKALLALGLNPKSTIETVSKKKMDLIQYLDEYFDVNSLGKRGVYFNKIKYPSVKKAFMGENLTEEQYSRYMAVKKKKERKGEITNKEEEKEFLHRILSGDFSEIALQYGEHYYNDHKYDTIEEMVNAYGYTLDQYNMYRSHRGLKGKAEDIFDIMRNDETFKSKYTMNIEYNGEKYANLSDLTKALGYEYSIFTSRMYAEGLGDNPIEFLKGIDEGKYDKPVRKRTLEQTKIKYIIETPLTTHEFTKQEDIADYLGIAKATLIYRARRAEISVEEMAKILVNEKDLELALQES